MKLFINLPSVHSGGDASLAELFYYLTLSQILSGFLYILTHFRNCYSVHSSPFLTGFELSKEHLSSKPPTSYPLVFLSTYRSLVTNSWVCELWLCLDWFPYSFLLQISTFYISSQNYISFYIYGWLQIKCLFHWKLYCVCIFIFLKSKGFIL